MRLSLLLLSLIAFSFTISAQQIEWLGTTRPTPGPTPVLGSDATGIAVDDEGNVYTVGMLYQNDQVGATTEYFISENGPFFNLSAESNGMFLLKQSQLGEVLWMKTWTHGFPEDIGISNAGEVVVAGVFNETLDFDPNAGMFEVTYSGGGGSTSGAAFVLKLNSSGEFLWVSDFQGAGGVGIQGISFGPNDEILATGSFSGNVYLGELVTSYMSIDGFVLCLDSNGDFLWNKLIYGVNANYTVSAQDVSVDGNGNVLVTGSFRGHVRFNGLESIALLTSSGSGPLGSPTTTPLMDVFCMKLSPSGDFLWVSKSSGTGDDVGFSIASDNLGNSYITGSFMGETNFGGLILGDNDDFPLSEQIFLWKLNSDGVGVWAKEFGLGQGWSIDVDASGNLAFVGHFGCCPASSETVDFDPGLGNYELVSAGHRDGFVCRIDNMGNLIWVEQFGYENSDIIRSVEMKGYTVYAAGYMAIPINQMEFPHGTMFNVKFNPDGECAAFNAVISEVQEAEFDNSGSITVSAYGGLEPYTYSWNTDPPQNEPVAVATAPGTYTVTVADEMGCERTLNVILSGPPAEDVGEFDLQANLGAFSLNNVCMSSGAIWLHIMNNGGDSVDGTVSIDLGPHLTYAQAIPGPSSVSGSVVSWAVEDFSFSSGPFLPVVYVSAPGSIMPGTTTCIQISVSAPEGDFNPANNSMEYCFPLLCSYDPNDKIVHPQGTGEAGFIEPNQTMTYTVRFQNTGTAPAFNIFILDTIDSNLDISTFRVVGQSHYPMITELEPGNVIRFRFDNIMLPDSGSNEPESHGYVIYEIDQMSNLGPGEEMLNTAFIYFDLNEPVQTNTVVNTIAWPVDVHESANTGLGFTLYPVPTHDVLHLVSSFPITNLWVMDIGGRIVYKASNPSGVSEIRCSQWDPGTYMIAAEQRGTIHRTLFIIL